MRTPHIKNEAERGGKDHAFFALALNAAQEVIGATAPNPPVGAAVVSSEGRLLSVAAHERAGAPHAEALAIQNAVAEWGAKEGAKEKAEALKGATVYVTLEPCNHQGRTPPCTQALIRAGVSRVVYGVADPNPRVAGDGGKTLLAAGLRAELVAHPEQRAEAEAIIAPFAKWCRTGLPYVVHKIALRPVETPSEQPDAKWTSVPPAGQVTFSSEASLRLAHLERRKADAIVTGMGTVLTDRPRFNIRLTTDHKRTSPKPLYVIGEEERLKSNKRDYDNFYSWKTRQEQELGFTVRVIPTLLQALKELGAIGLHRVLLEAGPKLSKQAEDQGLWDERLVIRVSGDGNPDHITRHLK